MFKKKVLLKCQKNINDIVYTPEEISKQLVQLVDVNPNESLLDPFFGSGSFFNNYPPENTKSFCEIELGIDFFKHDIETDIIISNPPYSMIDKVLQHSIKICRKRICYLVGVMNFTIPRIRFLNDNGFFITSLTYLRIPHYMTPSVFFIASKDATKNIISYLDIPNLCPFCKKSIGGNGRCSSVKGNPKCLNIEK